MAVPNGTVHQLFLSKHSFTGVHAELTVKAIRRHNGTVVWELRPFMQCFLHDRREFPQMGRIVKDDWPLWRSAFEFAGCQAKDVFFPSARSMRALANAAARGVDVSSKPGFGVDEVNVTDEFTVTTQGLLAIFVQYSVAASMHKHRDMGDAILTALLSAALNDTQAGNVDIVAAVTAGRGHCWHGSAYDPWCHHVEPAMILFQSQPADSRRVFIYVMGRLYCAASSCGAATHSYRTVISSVAAAIDATLAGMQPTDLAEVVPVMRGKKRPRDDQDSRACPRALASRPAVPAMRSGTGPAATELIGASSYLPVGHPADAIGRALAAPGIRWNLWFPRVMSEAAAWYLKSCHCESACRHTFSN